jgi:hypothetical protein
LTTPPRIATWPRATGPGSRSSPGSRLRRGETTPGGAQVAVKALDTTPTPPGLPGNGALFGLAVAPAGTAVYFVDDDANTLNLLN